MSETARGRVHYATIRRDNGAVSPSRSLITWQPDLSRCAGNSVLRAAASGKPGAVHDLQPKRLEGRRPIRCDARMLPNIGRLTELHLQTPGDAKHLARAIQTPADRKAYEICLAKAPIEAIAWRGNGANGREKVNAGTRPPKPTRALAARCAASFCDIRTKATTA
jgi:hypothetical protein